MTRSAAWRCRLVAMSAEKVVAVAAVIEREGKFLLGKRSAHKGAAGYWCPLSGRVEAGETQAEAVEREVLEEVGLEVRAVEPLEACETHDGTTVIHFWRVRIVGDGRARLANDEHSELGWFSPEEFAELEPSFAEDLAILKRAARDG